MSIAVHSPRYRGSSATRRVLPVPGVRRGAYLLVTGVNGDTWLLVPRRSAPDENRRSQLLRVPEPAWALAEGALSMARNAGAVGVRVADKSTGLVYEAPLRDFWRFSQAVQYGSFEPQRRLPLRLWTVRPSERPAPSGTQLSLFAAAP